MPEGMSEKAMLNHCPTQKWISPPQNPAKHPIGRLDGHCGRKSLQPGSSNIPCIRKCTERLELATTVLLALVKIACNVTIFCGQAQVLSRGFTVYTVVLGGEQEDNCIQRGLSHTKAPIQCGLTHVGLHPMIRISQLPRWQFLSTSPVLSGIPSRVGFTRVVKTM